METEKWVYSTNEEHFYCEIEYDDKESAIEGAKEDGEIEEGSTVWIGRTVKIDKQFLLNNGIVSVDPDSLCENLGNEVGEIADDWYGDVSKYTDKMSEIVAEYIMENCPPTFNCIQDIFEITK